MSDIQELKKANDEVEEYVKKLSAGRFEIDIEILPEKDWWVMDPALAFSGEPFFNNFPPVLEMIEKNDGKSISKSMTLMFLLCLDLGLFHL